MQHADATTEEPIHKRPLPPPQASDAVPPQVRGAPPVSWLSEEEMRGLLPLLREFTAEASAASPGCRCTIQLLEGADTLRTVVASETRLGPLKRTTFPVGVGIAGWVAENRRPVVVPDVSQEPQFAALGRSRRGAMACVPVADQHAFYGTLSVSYPDPRPLPPAVVALLRAHAHGAAVAIAQHRVERARAEFTAIVSHELRNPLASVYGFLDMVTTELLGPLNAEQREALEGARFGVRQLRRLADDITDLLQADLDRLVLRRAAVDVGEEIRMAIGAMAPLLKRTRLRIVTDIAAALPTVQADRVRLGQILTNLLLNAMKFSPPGVTVTVGARTEGDALRVWVRDAGAGIPEGERERIFGRFVKGDSPQRDAQGMGLGLAVVKQLAEAHGGRAWAEDAPGGGTVFAFTLPLRDASGGVDEPAADDTARRRETGRQTRALHQERAEQAAS